MNITKKAFAYHEKMFPSRESTLSITNPEFVELFDNFAFDEVVNHGIIDEHTRFISILASLIGCQCIDEYKVMLNAALNFGVTTIEMKEIVYQSVAYLGIGRVFPFLHAVNAFLLEQGIALPLEAQSTTCLSTRLEKGIEAQVTIFGDSMKDFYQSGKETVKHINYWLTTNCFGDYYTRTGLDLRLRELITFCFLVSQGGCEPQLIAHIKANIRVGNSQDYLISVISACIPYIGYPRCLNALNCIEEATK